MCHVRLAGTVSENMCRDSIGGSELFSCHEPFGVAHEGLYVGHDSFIRVTWLIHMCYDMTHCCVTWLIHMCDMTVRRDLATGHDSLMYDMARSFVWHDSYEPFGDAHKSLGV